MYVKQFIFYIGVLNVGGNTIDPMFDTLDTLCKKENRVFSKYKLWEKNKKKDSDVLIGWKNITEQIARLKDHMKPYKKLNELLHAKLRRLELKIRTLDEYYKTGVLQTRELFGGCIIITPIVMSVFDEYNTVDDFFALFDDLLNGFPDVLPDDLLNVLKKISEGWTVFEMKEPEKKEPEMKEPEKKEPEKKEPEKKEPEKKEPEKKEPEMKAPKNKASRRKKRNASRRNIETKLPLSYWLSIR